METNPQLDLAFEFVQFTHQNIFLTGKAGTGKTTFLKSLRERTFKRQIVVAPTGVAAINAGGVTMHSFFQLPFGPYLSEKVSGIKNISNEFQQKFTKTKIRIIKSIDLLIIDEISMVRADLLDAVDDVLRKYKDRTKPFGGVQLLMIGDLQQLSPIVKDDDLRILGKYYPSLFFFNSHALQQSGYITVNLTHVYRQSDEKFIHILNQVRSNELDAESADLLNQRFDKDFSSKIKEGYITLTTHNHTANQINEEQLDRIKEELRTFKSEVKGVFNENNYPAEDLLRLKIGAQVMFIKNDSSPLKRYYNGKMGTVVEMDDQLIYVEVGENELIETSREEWNNFQYNIDEETKEIKEEVLGTFIQYPLRLAWAITIHKSQGLTFEHAIIDAAAAFAHGQTYVALSRCKSLEGLVLSSRIPASAIIVDREVLSFNQKIDKNPPSAEQLLESKNKFQFELIEELLQYRQLKYQLQQIHKILNNKDVLVYGQLESVVQNILEKSIVEIEGIGYKFIGQIKNLMTMHAEFESNQDLLERLKKAGEFYHKWQEDHLLKPISEASFHTDNKATMKQLEDIKALILQLIKVKQQGYLNCSKQFNIKDFLHLRALALAENIEVKTKSRKQIETETCLHPDLLSLLKYWRRDTAEYFDIDEHNLMNYNTLIAIANELPSSMSELKKIHGVSSKKARSFGNKILEIIEDYLAENEIDRPLPSKIEITSKTKKVKTQYLTFELYKEGKSLKEIAQTRALTVGTVEGHLGYFIKSGELDIFELIEKDKLSKIVSLIEVDFEQNLTQLKEKLGDNFSYSQIRWVFDYLKKEEE